MACNPASACDCPTPGLRRPNTLIMRMRRSLKTCSSGPGSACACMLIGIHARSGLPTVCVPLKFGGATPTMVYGTELSSTVLPMAAGSAPNNCTHMS